MSPRGAQSVLAPTIKFTLFTVITLALTAVLISTIAAVSFGDKKSYNAMFTDVTGLLPGDDVRVAGVKVGTVKSIKVDGSNAKVGFNAQTDLPLTTTTTATVRYRNLIGQRYIALDQGAGTPSTLRSGGTIPLSRTHPALDLTALFNGFKPLFTALSPKDVNQLAYNIIQVLQGEGGTVGSLLAHTASLTNTLANRDALIGRVITNLNSVLGTVSKRDTKLSSLILQLQRLVSGFSADRKPIGDSLANISTLTTTTAGLLQQVRPPLKADIAQLGKLSSTISSSDAVLTDILSRMPNKLATLRAVGSSGSWFNFYLCQANVTIGVGDLNITPPASVDPVQSSAKRCTVGQQG